MAKITFHGLCGFARRANEVQVLMPDVKDHQHDHQHGKSVPAHRAFMVIRIKDIESAEWPMSELLTGPDGKQLGVWKLEGKDLMFKAGSSGEPAEIPKGIVSLADLHHGAKPADSKAHLTMSLRGGQLKERDEYPEKLEIRRAKDGSTRVKFKKYVEVIEWRSVDKVISSKLGTITLKKDDDEVAITNAAPGLSPNHEGLEHFAGYYSTLAIEKDDQLELIAEPDNERPPLVGGGNCVPNAELP